jgi:glycosyltransferase involved in cell wall biosynthesis
MKRIDVVVAVWDEEESIPRFIERIDRLELPDGVELNLVFIEDSSRDETVPLLRKLAAARSDIAYASLVRGYGQGIAVSFGLSRSDADASVMMDVDGSHPPEAIPELIQAFLAGAKVAQCVRRTLTDRKAYRDGGAALFHGLSTLIFGVDVQEQNVFFRLVSSDVRAMVIAEPRYWRYLRFPLPREPKGATCFIPVDTVERTHDQSKYNFVRLASLAIDGVLSLISVPRALCLASAVTLASVGFLVLGYWPLSIVGMGVLLRLVYRYFEIGKDDALQKIEVKESANFAA